MPRKTLVIGWFSFELMGATAGDIIAADLACGWLREVGIEPDVAQWEPRGPGEVRTDDVVPDEYDTLIFLCGPIGDGPPLNAFLHRFPHARKLALNVSLLQERSEWNPFVAIVERDSSERVNPDITFGAADSTVPLLGIIYVGPQEEYPNQRHDLAEQLFSEALRGRDVATIPIDTRLDVNKHGLSSPAQVESTIARMDAVLTTRLHGSALALRRGVPPVVIDSIPGGTKVFQQMQHVGWPLAFHAGDVDAERVADAIDFALTPEARELANDCAARAREGVARVEREFIAALLGEERPGGDTV